MVGQFGNRWRFFAEQRDMGREVSIVFTREDDEKTLQLNELVPVKRLGTSADHLIGIGNILTGNEPRSSFFTIDEAQQLMDVLYRAGLRPSRLA